MATTQPTFQAELDAVPTPPAGWTLEQKPPKPPGKAHWVWVSPTGATAYGIAYFGTPVPVFATSMSHTIAFRLGYLPAVRADEGEVEVLEKTWDEDRRALRFVVGTERYKLRSILLIRGSRGWAVYVGTDQSMQENEAEIAKATLARESTVLPVE